MDAQRADAGRRWFLYGPHWQIAGSTLRARQATFVKATTAFSSELGEEEKRYVPAHASFRASSIEEVQSPRERSRHDHSWEHMEVTLTPRSSEALDDLSGLWYIYEPHWSDAYPPAAKQDTWLKKTTGCSWDLMPHEKLPVVAGEVLALRAGPSPVADPKEATRHRHAAHHCQVVLGNEEFDRLRWKAPRPPLCKYFASDAEALVTDMRDCFLNSQFGPGVHPPAEGIQCPHSVRGGSELALLLPHGGYCNSGFVAAHGFQLLAQSAPCPVAIIIGNNHQSWHKFALSDQTWATPLGPVEPALPIVETLRDLGYPIDRAVHAEEHSIENQLPFLRFVRPGLKIVPVGVGAVDLHEAEQLAGHIARLAEEHGAVLLGTTDFSHEGPSYGGPALSMQEVTALTREKDGPLLQSVVDMDAARLLRLSKGSSMCGPGSASVFLLACQALGLTRVKTHRYLVNTEVTPCSSTTGFATFSFQPPQ